MFSDNERLFIGLFELIERWKPKVFSKEKDYQTDLYNYLKDLQDSGKINKRRLIRREGGANRLDLMVDKIGIELKKSLKTQGDIDRAVAQVKRMLKEIDYIIVVLVGECNRQSVDLLKHEIRDFVRGGDFMGDGKHIKLIEVGKKISHDEPKGIFDDLQGYF